MPPLHFLNETLLQLSERQLKNSTANITVDSYTSMSPQTIALTAVSILFTLSEMLGLIPNIEANGLLSGILYYGKTVKPKKPGEKANAHPTIEQLELQLQELKNAQAVPNSSSLAPPIVPTGDNVKMDEILSAISSLQNTVQSMQAQNMQHSYASNNNNSFSDRNINQYVPPNNFVN
jgi:hypothetical protein